MTSLINLHIGGHEPKDGWKILDIESGHAVDIVADAAQIPLPDKSCSIVYASHVLEHYSHAEIPLVLAEWHRVLALDGQCLISVPDLPTIAGLYASPQAACKPELRDWCQRVIYGGQTTSHDYHRTGFDAMRLSRLMVQAGFNQVRRVAGFGLFEDSSVLVVDGVGISLNIVGIKDAP